MACSVSWPCPTSAGKFGEEPYYEQNCPVHWSQQPDGSCRADPGYDGPCPNVQNFLMYTPSMKATWGANCSVSWPLGPARPVLLPPAEVDRSKPSEAVWAKCGHDYRFPCPITFSQDAKGVCRAPVTYPFRNMALCASFDTYRWTADMKQAFEKACLVSWPCSGEFPPFVMASSALLLGLTFL
mmetsp:Transcript_113210/g.352882  ORF Transcript_113210/g.352882 Transcript_113210/m.352882 type:complete len:183 (+) Transcript_113210:369-917(+)